MARTTNSDGLHLIQSFEGCRLDSYRLEGEEDFTIGYGHSNDKSITKDTVWTQAQADSQLKKDLNKFEGYVEQYAKDYKLTFNDNQFAALVSYCYNRGPGGLKELLSHSKTVNDVANNIVVYWGSAERYKAGLIRRREAEKALFLKPIPATHTAPTPHPPSKPVQHAAAKPAHKPAKTIEQLVEETMRGMHGSGRERMINLGSNYAAVQKEVNRRLQSK